jgi:hypothetical protein
MLLAEITHVLPFFHGCTPGLPKNTLPEPARL